MSRLAINIVTHNSAATLTNCFGALDAQTYRDFDLCVLDNASTDDTLRFLTTRSDIWLIMSATNIGYAAAHNQLIGQTESEYVLTLNPDVALEPDYLGEIIAALDSASQVGSAAGLLLRVDRLDESPVQIDSAGLFMRVNRRQGLRFEGQLIADSPKVIEPIFGPDGAAACYRRTMLVDISVDGEVFDTDFFMHKEDVDVCWRAQLRGWNSVFVPDAVARHVRGFRPGQRQQVNDDLRFYSVRNRYLLIMKNEQLPHLLRNLGPILWYDLCIVVYLLLFEWPSLRAFASIWNLRQKMFAKRQSIQAHHCVSWHDLQKWFR